MDEDVMTECIEDDRSWSRRVAGIAVATLLIAEPKLVELTLEQVERCTEIVSEEIFIRLTIGDRPPLLKL